ncbi:MAG: hypothetical protein GTO03_18115, partial [Planctomycetales bacterium]|nr:hypothetical protein [Planctomycetales bacterium]
MAAHDHALAEGMRQPVVFLVDCEDPLGSQIARQWAGDDAVDAAILATATESDSDSAEETSTTTLVQAFPFEECRREVPPLFPYLAGSFQR